MRIFFTLFILFFSLNVFSQKTTIIVADTADARASYRVLENMFGGYSNDTWTVLLEASYTPNTKQPEDAVISLCKFEKEMTIPSKKLEKYELIYSKDIARNKDAKNLKAILNKKGVNYYLVFKDDIKKKKVVAYEIYINIDCIE